MGTIEKGSVIWPPRGWKQLACIKQSAGQALAKDIRTAKIFGLSFQIESEPLYQLEARFFRHKIFIDGWQYSILNESSEYPVLSFIVTDRYDIRQPREAFVSDIRIMAKPMENRPVVVQRTMMAAQLLIKQIQMGQVPDYERILSIYHLHPKRSSGGTDAVSPLVRHGLRASHDEDDAERNTLPPTQ
jgi:hypothetical protein